MTFNGAERTQIHVAHTSVTAESRRHAALKKKVPTYNECCVLFSFLVPKLRKMCDFCQLHFFL